MAKEWFYTKDGKTRLGPVVSAELRTMAACGQLLPTDMLCQQGSSQWVAAGAIKGLFISNQTAPSDLQSSFEDIPIVPAWPSEDPASATPGSVIQLHHLTVAAAACFSLLAGGLALARVGGELLGPIVAGIAILVSFVALAIGLSSRASFAYLGSAATAVFLSVAALAFSIGCSIADEKIAEARGTILRAAEIAEDRKKGEQAWANAEKARQAAVSEPEEIRRQVEKDLKTVATERAVLESDKKFLANARAKLIQDETKLASDRERFNRDAEDLRRNEESLAKEGQKLKLAEDKLKEDEAKLALTRDNLLKREEKLKLDLQEPSRLRKEAVELSAKAEGARKQSERNEQEAARHYKNVKEIYEKLQKQLNTSDGKKAAIRAISEIGRLPPVANVDFTQVNYDLCEVAVFESGLRSAALDALDKIEPDFSSLTREVLVGAPTKGGEYRAISKYKGAIESLPKFGRASVPLVRGLVRWSGLSYPVSDDLQGACKVLTDECKAIDEYVGILIGIQKAQVKNDQFYITTTNQLQAITRQYEKTETAKAARALVKLLNSKKL